MRHPPILVCIAALLLTGCHSAYIEADLVNQTSNPITLVELDYPSASFGTQTLAPAQHFHYRFKVLGSGSLKLIYTDAAHHELTIPGPTLNEGNEGRLTVTLTTSGVIWTPPTMH